MSSHARDNHVGGDDAGPSFAIFMVVVAIGVLLALGKMLLESRHRSYQAHGSTVPPVRRTPPASIAKRMRAVDKTFSEPVFLEFAQLLYTRVHEARGTHDLSAVSPYLTDAVIDGLRANPEQQPVTDIKGVIVGHSRLERILIADPVRLDVVFRANWTAVFTNGREQAYWVEELWSFTRRAAARSRTPELVDRLGCPSCGSAAERTELGRCAHCGGTLVPGEADWCVAARHEREVSPRPPLLTGVVEEVGTDLGTVKDVQFGQAFAQLPDFAPARFTERARHIFLSLQASWSRSWLEGMRPYETDALFSQHRFWIEEYRRQGLRNILDDLQLSRIEPCKVDRDAFYDSITCRMHASARDYTVRIADRQIVGGRRDAKRHFTEYWTFIRRKGAPGVGSDVQCPSCMASLSVTHTGVCEHCATKLTRGDFDWVLSRIEQDEEYVG